MPLIRNIHKQDKELKFIITTNTITGGKIVAQQNLDYIYHCYMPVDWMYNVKKFLAAVKPASIFIMETEIWPNLLTACQKNNVR
jgi:3-deoxy-D-manno-octulosonic-acid transferase